MSVGDMIFTVGTVTDVGRCVKGSTCPGAGANIARDGSVYTIFASSVGGVCLGSSAIGEFLALDIVGRQLVSTRTVTLMVSTEIRLSLGFARRRGKTLGPRKVPVVTVGRIVWASTSVALYSSMSTFDTSSPCSRAEGIALASIGTIIGTSDFVKSTIAVTLNIVARAMSIGPRTGTLLGNQDTIGTGIGEVRSAIKVVRRLVLSGKAVACVSIGI